MSQNWRDPDRRQVLSFLLLAGAGGLLAGCGKKARPRAPEGQESSYTYPRPYPNPKTVLESGTASDWEEPNDRPNRIDLSPAPGSRDKTVTYGSE